MRYRTKKRAKDDRKANPIEWEWLANFDRCGACNKRKIITTHHMVGGPNRWRAKGVLAALFPACWDCNRDDLEDETKWPLSKQLAVKKRIDPANYCLKTINALLGVKGDPNPHQRITEKDVAVYL